jgi:mRNA-decapping enzyme subunit 2
MQVLEETGCDVSTLLKMEDYIEVSIAQQRVRLYIITGVKRDTVFAPQTKKEISVCRILKILLYHFFISQNA